MLPTYQGILVATDLSPHASLVFRHAVMLARFHKAPIYLVHVVQKLDNSARTYVATVLGEESLNRLEEDHQKEALQTIRQKIVDLAQAELAGFPEDQARFSEVEVRIGNPVEQILAAVKQHQADVIVMGTHSKGRIEHSFLGSVAEKIIARAVCPTFVVPLPKD
ncbi:MAG: universal stress protein [Deltaproteobacteria bacterium]|nr:universal stress protein [Deltaproteobacteria bacterium]NCP02319.1 universal stress protein [Deltaproteobacteria bacterium]NCP77843.1 universal stress protein [Desulfuromonadales bacterium]